MSDTMYREHGALVALPSPQPDPAVAGILRDMLTRAERGEIIGVAVIAEHPGGRVGTVFSGHNEITLAGGAHLLIDRIMQGYR